VFLSTGVHDEPSLNSAPCMNGDVSDLRGSDSYSPLYTANATDSNET